MRGALQHRFEPGLVQCRKIIPQINYIVFKSSQHRRDKTVASANRVDKAANRMCFFSGSCRYRRQTAGRHQPATAHSCNQFERVWIWPLTSAGDLLGFWGRTAQLPPAQLQRLAAHKAGTSVGCGISMRGGRDRVLRDGFFGFWLATL